MDDVDRAKERELEHRRLSVESELASHVETEAPLIINGERCCVDCREQIPMERLAARPNSVRCIECKEIREQKQKGYR
ncbi:TraR/DksA family transcriptional regulator [Sedimenticola selenatireducens]|uniref:TraR/DksA family transcriptional regulator n=1 Tax=Sedimenticola selenatireducens TaxID=191960 RepID=A0A557S0J1_9GAMM|nr:TraR/DksA C4-type zinc finger protein [Sedimenticola selenatireducens]TVO70886.1 TraR/DksA family transcriptional regulator [Sedimenticola selenatireducens]